MRDLANAVGIVTHRSYNTFGVLTDEIGVSSDGNETANAVDCIFGYTGKLFDEVTELQNNVNRWYNPELGKWLSEDPIGFNAGDTNIYRYVGNMPSIYGDFLGLQCAKEETARVIGADVVNLTLSLQTMNGKIKIDPHSKMKTYGVLLLDQTKSFFDSIHGIYRNATIVLPSDEAGKITILGFEATFDIKVTILQHVYIEGYYEWNFSGIFPSLRYVNPHWGGHISSEVITYTLSEPLPEQWSSVLLLDFIGSENNKARFRDWLGRFIDNLPGLLKNQGGTFENQIYHVLPR